ncbi:MAG: efflux RND transporter periplasmic adaptor subunit [Candidatus Aminicenantes bacterium]|jgi:cobalt-zinc-cadmium efflux system membrane fusion protein
MKKICILLSILVLAFCGGYKDETAAISQEHEHSQEEETHVHQKADVFEEGHKQPAEEEEHEHADVRVSPEKQKEWGIEVGPATTQNISSRISLPGVLALNQNQTAHISSFVAGKVVEIPVDLGTRVKKGQDLLTINSPEFAQAQADFLEARARLNLSQREFERAKKLWEEKAIEEKEFFRREAELEKIMTEYGALGSALHSFGLTHKHIDELIAKCDAIKDAEYKCEIANPDLTILSPITGTVVFRDVILGEHVIPEKTLFTVSNMRTLWAQLDAYEKDLPLISQQSRVTIFSPLYPEKKIEGKITYISDLIDEKLRTVKIRVEVNNSEGQLKPNMYIQGIIENVSEEKDILVIPEEAVQNLDGEKIVFVPEGPDVFAVCHVHLGPSVGSMRIVTGGLKEGVQIVLKGAFYLKAELTKSKFGHTHVH